VLSVAGTSRSGGRIDDVWYSNPLTAQGHHGSRLLTSLDEHGGGDAFGDDHNFRRADSSRMAAAFVRGAAHDRLVGETSVAKSQEADEPGVSLPQTSLLMAAVAAGALIGVAIVLVWEPGWNHTQKDHANSGPFVLWVALIAAQAMLWAVALPSLVGTLLRHWRNRQRDSVWREVVPSAGGFVVLIVAFAVLPRLIDTLHTVPPDLIPHVALRVAALTGLGGLVALVAAISIWLIRGRAEVLAAGRKLTGGELRTYLRLRSDLERLLAYLGAVIGLAVLTTAALWRLVVQEYGDEQFPPEVLILYGVVLTLIIALVYLPTWATMQRTGSLLRDGVAPLPEPASDQLEAQLRTRAALDDLLGLRVSASVSFKAGVAILSPLLASLTSLLPKLGG
jgi:hypothetical protein